MDRGERLTPRATARPPHQRGRQRIQQQKAELSYSSSEGEDQGLNGEHHVSPIENLDNTISRLYSYLSGSEGEPDTDHPGTPLQTHQKWHRRPGSRSPSPCNSSISSRSSSPSMMDDEELDRQLDLELARNMDTLNSLRSSENHYSHITDTNTLPMMPPIPPPPLESVPGPAVPPRRSNKHFNTTTGVQAGGRSRRSGGYPTDMEEEVFEPQFLVQTASGNVFVPSGRHSPTSSPPVPSFPRTVPRTASLPQPPPPPPTVTQLHPTITDTGHIAFSPTQQTQPSRFSSLTREGSMGRNVHLSAQPLVNAETATQTGIPPSNSSDRIKHQLKEIEDNWASNQNGNPSGNQYVINGTAATQTRQNPGYNPNANLLPPLPTYPSIQNDFRDYSRFNSTKFSVKKHLKGKCSWRCVALVIAAVAVFLLALLAYFIAMKAYNLNWSLEKIPIDADLNCSDHTSLSKGAYKTPPVINKQYQMGRPAEEKVAPNSFWRTTFFLPEAKFIKYNVSVPQNAVIGIYGRRNVQPSHVQYDFFHRYDGNDIMLMGGRQKRDLSSHRSGFIEYLDEGLWYVYFYNDDNSTQTMGFVANEYDGTLSECPSSCHGRGECVDGNCQCFTGYTGWDCSQSVFEGGSQTGVCPELCKGNGVYVRGHCQCFEGWKGSECDVPRHQCEDPTCNGNGKCVDGTCVCSPGFTGYLCSEVTCLDPACGGNGICVDDTCICLPGFHGSDCRIVLGPSNPNSLCVQDCTRHGFFDFRSQQCNCESGWYGTFCELEVCRIDCVHGHCEEQRCVCDEGFTGAICDQLECDARCTLDRGVCNNGTCQCEQGWNGKYCSLDGCPRACSNHGTCTRFSTGWLCTCTEGWKGEDCGVPIETICDDNVDEDADGLTDCQDPDCCINIACRDSNFCTTSPDPMEILLRKQPPSSTASFAERMGFLIEDDSVQKFARSNSFNQSQVAVIRGQVVTLDGSPVVGVRVAVDTQPLYGFTLTREMGLFDILVNGGGSVVLFFQRLPFKLKKTTVMVPWNRMVTMETVVLTVEGQREPMPVTCTGVSHDHYNTRPVVLSTWQHTQLGACPDRSTMIPESQVIQESLAIPGTDLYLVYHSSETAGYMSTILIKLTPDTVVPHLAVVHLKVAVEGLIFEKTLEADVSLKYKFAWDRRNAYNQKVYGIVTASVSVGYQYMGCNKIFWETQSATMSGYDITSSEIGGWNLNIHHTYNFQEGILHKGDGTNIYLKERPRKVVTVAGNGRERRPDCRGCDGPAGESRLMAPVALASGRDGSLYVGDFNFIRKLDASRGELESILKLSMVDFPYKYFMTVSPLDGKLYISDSHSRRLLRVKTMGAIRDISENQEVIAGTGEQCVPGDANRCGDGGLANDTKLLHPKGIAINKEGQVFFADGATVRTIKLSGVMDTVIGHLGQPTEYKPLPCAGMVTTDEVTLHWPTALAINPLDDTLHILDDNMVLKVTHDKKILITAGRPLHCPPLNTSYSSLLSDEQSGPKLATEVYLHSAQHIAFAPNGDLFVVESDGKFLNQIRVVHTDGTISHYAGATPKCNCQLQSCQCYDPSEELVMKMLLNSPTAITVTPDNVLHVADRGNRRVHSIIATLPLPDRLGHYEVLFPQTQESYLFNRYGQHLATKNIVTDQYIYNFTYSVNSYYGKLERVIDGNENELLIDRHYTTQAKAVIPPGGQASRFVMDNMAQLHMFIAPDNSTSRFTYFSNTGLLETKETSDGRMFVYEYDEHGRLASVIQPTGKRREISTDVSNKGALVSLHTDGKDLLSLTTNGKLLSILHDHSESSVSYLHDGSLIMEYPFNMAVTLETSPHPLLSTDHQLQVRRKIILPENHVHRLEWRYYLRRDGKRKRTRVIDRVGRRMRVGKTGSRGSGSTRLRHADTSLHEPGAFSLGSGYEGKNLLVNGVNLLTFEFDRNENSESIMNSESEEIVLIHYTDGGQIAMVAAQGPIMDLNVTYNSNGFLTNVKRGDIGINYLYDERTGHVIEKRFSNDDRYRYIYKSGNKPTDVILPSGKQYLLHYDQYGNLRSIIMPNTARHQFHSLATLGRQRIIYHPAETHGTFTQDYDSSGNLILISYPSNHRRVVFYYTDKGKPSLILHDWMEIKFTYHSETDKLHSVNISSIMLLNYSCSLVFLPGDALVKEHAVLFQKNSLGFASARFHYSYDSSLMVNSIQTFIGNHAFRSYNISYSDQNGKLTSLKSFTFEYSRIHHHIIRDANMEITKEFDNYGRHTDDWYKFNNFVKYTLEVQYDNRNRLSQWRRRIGSNDLKIYAYVYDVDGNVIELLENSRTTFRYEYDPNNNIVSIRYHSNVRTVTINSKNQVESCDEKSYIFDQDGFLVQREDEVFEYNSNGQLIHAFENGKYDIYYFYDGLGRLTARKDKSRSRTIQYFYSDLQNKGRITHIYDQAEDLVSILYYDNNGQLFAMEVAHDFYYIALDPIGSPILIMNSVGSVVKQLTFDPLGKQVSDSAPDFPFALGYRCGVLDPTTELLFLADRVYDPTVGRWTSPNYAELVANVGKVVHNPAMTNLYQNHHLVNTDLPEEKLWFGIDYWLKEAGYNTKVLVPSVTFAGDIHSPLLTPPHRAPSAISVTSAFECAFNRDMNIFSDLSSVPRSKVTSMHPLDDVVKSFAPLRVVFGEGILLYTYEGHIIVSVIDSAVDELAELATVLLNDTRIVDIHLGPHGRDTLYMVKGSISEAVDAVDTLALSEQKIISGVNVTIHRHIQNGGLAAVDIRLHANHTLINIRYGSSALQEQRRILAHAKERAIENAWIVERELVQSQKQTINHWSQSQERELLSRGRVRGAEGVYIRDINQYPELADDPKNIQFVFSSR